uniref:phage tail sheath family protein n=1 Tax=Serratia proteamaculans TaxID=28151 RepID=UPI001F4C13F1|nr:phage tail sheath C-terminal domain-containing protein [Serratia proteamaculans]ULG16492.1 phage tail protein [Serratia proteamaculans]
MIQYGKTTPGVNIQEWEQNSSSVKPSVTAIPVFIGIFIAKDNEKKEVFKINSTLEFKKVFCPARVVLSRFDELYFSESDDEHGGSPRPGQVLHSISSPNCVSGGNLIYKFRLGHHVAGYNTLNVKCNSNSTAKIDIDFDSQWSVKKDNGVTEKRIIRPEENWGVNVYNVNGVDLKVKTNPKSKGKINIEGNCLNKKTSTGYIWSMHNAYSESYNAVELYFQNDGGPCYILPLVDGSDAELAALPGVIRARCPDATLLVCADTDAGLVQLTTTRTKQEIYHALNPLLQASPAYFLLADSTDGTYIPNVEPTQAAVYYPALQTSACVDDADIEVVGGYWQPAISNLAQLQSKDHESYELIRQSLSPLRDAPHCSPSPAIAAAYCRNDRERGVWKAPANISLIGVKGLAAHISEEEWALLNNKGINVIRWSTERGSVIYGARTLSDSFQWRYISVRRLFNTVENDIKKILQPVMFKPNCSLTWSCAQAAVHNYLFALWRKGALFGNNHAEAFFVKIGEGATMQPEDVAAGKMIIQIGMAAVRPAEFITLQFRQSELSL